MNIPKISQLAMLVEVNNYSQVELYGRIILAEVPEHPQGLLAISWANWRAGLNHFARDHYRRFVATGFDGVVAATDLKIPVAQLTALQQLASSADAIISVDKLVGQGDNQRYLLIKAWGFGFWSDVLQVLGGLMLAEMTYRKPVVHWGENSLYCVDKNKNAFNDFFAPVGPPIESLVGSELDCFPPKWRSENLHNENVNKTKGDWSKVSGLNLMGQPEAIAVLDYYIGILNLMPYIEADSAMHGMTLDQIYTYLINKYLLIRPDLIARANQFCQREFAGEPFLAAHVRGSDKVGEFKVVDKFHDKYQQLIAQQQTHLPADCKLFLMTDDNRLLENYRQLFGERLVITDCLRTDTHVGVHYQAGDEITRAAEEVIVDTLIAAQALRFVGNGFSNPSIFVCFLGRWSGDECLLIGGNRMRHYNTHLYKTISVI